MADVFLSYFNKDRKRVERIAKLLEAQGISVWWDTTLRAGEHWGEVIERELTAARCVVVCWSEGAVKSRWVREEANHGLKRNVLVPLLLNRTEPPVGFQMIQATNISSWNGSSDATVARDVVNAVNAVLQRPPVTQLVAPPDAQTFATNLVPALLAVALVAAGGLGVYALMRPASLQPPRPQIVVPAKPSTADIARVWDQIKTEDSIPLFEDFLSDFGRHSPTHARLARNRIAKLKADIAKSAAAPPVLLPPAKPPARTAPDFKPWTIAPLGTPTPGTAKSTCTGATKDACNRLFGCMWDDKLNFFGGCKPFTFKPNPPSPTPIQPIQTTCVALTKDGCNRLTGCTWDSAVGLAGGCKSLLPNTKPQLKPTPTVQPTVTKPKVDCGAFKSEQLCSIFASSCSWWKPGVLFKDGACLPKPPAPK